ncbi:YegP family protein [Rhizobium ruizarguesonis]
MPVRPSGLKYPCYWMYKDNVFEWRWVYYGTNGEEIAVSSEGYKNKADCRRGVDIMKASTNNEVFIPTSEA